MTSVKLLPGALSEIAVSVADTQCLTKADCYALMAAILDDSLDLEERSTVDRLLYFLRRGRIRVIDQISQVM
ncbi:hypothetical protein [Lyngbya sp. CCY1209]|jgi:hypothetical protein|uniref:hypothetical protein n=1 Tax=Lyngbya sp. CCY1209 TaxID=2886103 RepID=UPI002D20D215|nr:hypothetical protein [Lyngbya sp. CCY1209]MEB3886865.1 hypothetical protein [Lyngbya sp. CCY1209]